ncbi:MAG: hypothetical protein A3B86_04380 [Candidatus Yanofskybacteria bacterium RIFCSPHIGHO2_02_FULL_38_22b]|uniref:DUF2784 domain-containing protein n=1 Tax=Candidatus Yanofskybacteria bacterium RIFCSPHIGHO2_02_FULL_38_22b TaxID=1802673 RepID=A0A1F8EZP0_9BACT|nr:MAG: hypothetical protein A2816_02150 [Candidatus Yanofskybacteria bacterium RIFCSPHIGHO2_01_FULL_39_44]OGN06323.1 MAG: hypothetical protein A3B86_04380 [Candidatus Yanofskybacteria bacterium RIFCSPHIGHO2_02_FULL_38_22b]OGN19742.1 MAG: hypothetical protein A2910_04115 [Candidatus Yanofskybacteria bacterium RIFCSPLOWO2_01_FULL_39_28]
MIILLADALTAIHTILILSVFIGIFLSIRIKRFRPIEALVLLVAIVIWSLYEECPLTSAEVYLRNLSGQVTSLGEVGFIAYYLSIWFNLSIYPTTITFLTYVIAFIFLLLSIAWELPYLKRLRQQIHRSEKP